MDELSKAANCDAQACRAPTTPVEDEVQKLHHLITIVEGRLNTLESRLLPVLRNTQLAGLEGGPLEPADDSRSPLVDEMVSMSNRLRYIIKGLEAVEERLDV